MAKETKQMDEPIHIDVGWKLEFHKTYVEVKRIQAHCINDNHTTVITYSNYHDIMVQICFDCEKVRTDKEAF